MILVEDRMKYLGIIAGIKDRTHLLSMVWRHVRVRIKVVALEAAQNFFDHRSLQSFSTILFQRVDFDLS